MKLLDLAKKNLREFTSTREALEVLATTQQTPLSYVAAFLISQGFETNISTYDADKYYVIHSNDERNWGKFEYTYSILSRLADDEKYKQALIFDENDIPEDFTNTYWKRSELYNLDLIKNLSIDFYFRTEDIKNIVSNRTLNLENFESNDYVSDDDVKKLLKSDIPSYLPNSIEKFSIIDDFVTSILGFFDCDFDKGFLIQKDELKHLFFNHQIIIKGFNDNLSKSNLLGSRNIWDAQYLNILKDDVPDLEIVADDLSHYDLYIESEKIQIEVKKEVPLLYLNDTLTVIEAACIISGDNPAEIIEIQNDEALLASYKRFKNAKSVVDSAIKLRTLTEYSDINILAYDFKVFLKSRGYIIEGFNDDLDEKESLAELTEQIQRQAVYIAQIENEIGFYQSMSHSTLRDVDFDKLLDAQSDEAFSFKADKTILENRVLFLEQQLENSQIEVGKLNTLLDGYSKSGNEVIQNLDSITPEQEIPHSRQRNNVLKIISILSDMAGLPSEPFTAFNMMEAHATQNSKEIPKKDTTTTWLKKARDSN